jgi:TRAP-type mannitol/chloroaromatic compound transport system substrate-binding protein
MKIKVHAGGAVVPYAEVTDAVKNGVIELGTPNASIDLGRIGPKALLLGASGATGGMNPVEYLTWFYTGGGMDYVQKEYDRYNIKVLGIITATPAELFAHSKKPLTEVKDFKGLKFRTMGLWGEVLTKMGASVVNISGGEIYESMQRGVIDAFEFCGPGINWDMGYVDVAKFIGVPGIHSPFTMENLLVNKNAWEKLPADMKAIFLQTTQAYSLKSLMTLTMDDAEKFQKFQDSGKVKVFEVSPEVQKEFIRITKEIHAKYCQEVPGYKEIYDNQRNFVKKFKNLTDKLQPKLSVYNP